MAIYIVNLLKWKILKFFSSGWYILNNFSSNIHHQKSQTQISFKEISRQNSLTLEVPYIKMYPLASVHKKRTDHRATRSTKFYLVWKLINLVWQLANGHAYLSLLLPCLCHQYRDHSIISSGLWWWRWRRRWRWDRIWCSDNLWLGCHHWITHASRWLQNNKTRQYDCSSD